MKSGFLLINKHAGISSYDAIRHIKRLLPKGTKIGHAGTIDPMAEGLLIVGIGRQATRRLGRVMHMKKTYRAQGVLGKSYDTQDTTGKLIDEKDASHISKRQFKRTLDDFSGNITQLPPMFSALKHKGKPLYTLARKGEEIERSPRTVHIYNLKLKRWSPPTFELKTQCSSGTYVRTLIHDIGNQLGVGAAMSGLQRTKIGTYKLRKAVTLEQLHDERDVVAALRPD